MSKEQAPFTVLTWNVLAHSYARPKYYPGVPAAHLDPGARRELLLRRLAGAAFDIGCFQEVEAEVAGAILAAFPAYQGRWAQREGRRDGCLTVWRADRFALVEERVVRYREAEGGELALLVGLRAAGEGTGEGTAEGAGALLWVACTHLRWMPSETPPEEHTGVLQARELLSEVAEIRARGLSAGAAPIWLVCGDLNDTAQGPVLRELYAAGLQESCKAQRPWDTVNINNRRRKLDYVLFDGPLRPAPEPLVALHRGYLMPSEIEPSDHLALFVRFSLVAPPP